MKTNPVDSVVMACRQLKRQRNELSAEKKELQLLRHASEQEKQTNAAALAKFQDEKRLIQQVIQVLVQRLKLQLVLLSIVPTEVQTRANANGKQPASGSHRDLNGSTLNEFLHKFQSQHVDKWRTMHSKWEQLQQELDDADWQLVHMKHRLEELCLEDQQVPGTSRQPVKSHSGGGMSTTSPFSDAVAAGKDTAPVAEQLKTSASSRSLCPPATDTQDKVQLASALAKGDAWLETLAKYGTCRLLTHLWANKCVCICLLAEEQETFALALAKEMKAMKDSYEAKLEELSLELRTTQRLRMESTQRLRAELDDERKRKQHVVRFSLVAALHPLRIADQQQC